MLIAEGHSNPLDAPLFDDAANLRCCGMCQLVPQPVPFDEAVSINSEQRSGTVSAPTRGDRSLVGVALHQGLVSFAAHGDWARR